MNNFPVSTTANDRGPVRCRTGPLVVSAALLLTLATVSSAQNRGGVGRNAIFGERIDPRFGVLEVARSIDVERVGASEVIGSPSGARSSGHYRPGGFATVGLDLDTRVMRTIPAVWRLRVARVDDLQRMNVRCELQTLDGRRNLLSHESDPGSFVQARIDPTPPRILETGDETTLIEGGVTLQMDLRNVRASGSHTGILTVTVEYF
jgi:hypothetical protein